MCKEMTVVCPFFKDKKQEPIEWFRPLKGGSRSLPGLHKGPHTERLSGNKGPQVPGEASVDRLKSHGDD